jgi:16S rRNA (cytidine1402-2'-O)-methyltransferase
MPLRLVAVPIGDVTDITARAIETLRSADIVVGEERKEVSKLLKSLGIEGKRLELLNEHSKDEDVRDLLILCRTNNVALVSDCGTPGFCDPGARLVAACRKEQINMSPIPGASSLMCLLSVTGHDMREFLFRGFLPADREERAQSLRALDRERRPIVLMDTPYRLVRLLSELAQRWPERRAVLGCDFTQATEIVIEATLAELPQLVGERKAEFIMVVFPGPKSETAASSRHEARVENKHEAKTDQARARPTRDQRTRKPFFPNKKRQKKS